MNQVEKEAWEKKSNTYDQLTLIAQACASEKECSVQEEVYYHTMPELYLHNVFPAGLFANTNLPENRYRFCVNEKEIKQLPESSTDIFNKNILDSYKDRPLVNLGLVNIQL